VEKLAEQRQIVLAKETVRRERPRNHVALLLQH
jgi:hypothetical protein